MRISDWSSDVCSSDLLRAHPRTRNYSVEARTACAGPRGCRGRRVHAHDGPEAIASVCSGKGGGCGVDAEHATASPPRCTPHHNRTGSMDPCSVAGLRTCEWASKTHDAAPFLVTPFRVRYSADGFAANSTPSHGDVT